MLHLHCKAWMDDFVCPLRWRVDGKSLEYFGWMKPKMEIFFEARSYPTLPWVGIPYIKGLCNVASEVGLMFLCQMH